MTCKDGTLFTELMWEDYRLLRNNYVERNDILENFLIKNEGKYPNIRVVFNDIIQYISYAYMFSDHKNKGYYEQLAYLKRHKPYIWKCQDTNLDIGFLPTDVQRHISTYMTYYTDNIITHMMAIAANMAFSMYSD
jgi:hypothetical protein